MNAIPWRGVVTEDGKHFLADEMSAFKLHLAQHAGHEVEVIVRPVRRRQSAKRRGLYHAVHKAEFRRFLVETFREAEGLFTFEAAHELLVRCCYNLWTDEGRPSTSIDAMDDAAHDDFVFRAEGILTLLGVELPDAEPDPIRRYERKLRPAAREIAGVPA